MAAASLMARPQPLTCWAPIVDAVGDKIEVFFDSGIRTGIDIMKAMAMGAKGTMVGRAYIYGLGAGGEAGVTRALEILKSELDVTMGLCGEKDITKVGRHNLMLPHAALRHSGSRPCPCKTAFSPTVASWRCPSAAP